MSIVDLGICALINLSDELESLIKDGLLLLHHALLHVARFLCASEDICAGESLGVGGLGDWLGLGLEHVHAWVDKFLLGEGGWDLGGWLITNGGSIAHSLLTLLGGGVLVEELEVGWLGC